MQATEDILHEESDAEQGSELFETDSSNDPDEENDNNNSSLSFIGNLSSDGSDDR